MVINRAGASTSSSTGPEWAGRGSGGRAPQKRNAALRSSAPPHRNPSNAALFKELSRTVFYDDGLAPEILSSALTDMSALDGVNPALTRYGRKEPAPVLPLREEPDLLSWLETSGRLVEDEESSSPEVSTVEEEELSALMGEKEDYNAADEQNEENWED